ncbi:hypothetical protein PV08_04783 [Exophiala spinifera]|uniref:Auxin efflux carrier n=1 Tax=Exophiala spinifera TaxID=91928 RepID=A0A0D2BF40_9EURO|nr:uncharacterized protein PV08_04783 [Exophiala spinifera]KIW17588.1 hypothetical protein PV08_04783 [Exophiala spinifera]
MAPTTGLVNSFLAAIQASLSVLLVIFYGGVAAHLRLLTPANTKAISKVCVRMFLPALLVTKIGSELHSGSAGRYLIVLAWAVVCHVVSFVVGVVAHLWLGMPDWTTVALMFNNTTSYPLLLIGALEQTGILTALITDPENETTAAAVERAKSYFLVFATVSSCLTFAVGPRLIDTEHAAESGDGEAEEDKDDGGGLLGDERSNEANGDGAHGHDGTSGGGVVGVTRRDLGEDHDRHQDDNEGDEHTRLLGGSVLSVSTLSIKQNSFFPSTRRASVLAWDGDEAGRGQATADLNRRPSMVPRRHWIHLTPRTKWWLLFVSDFFNAPLLGAIVGAVIGLVPSLHRAFFNDTYEGGIFTAWLTSSWKSIGSLFVPLPVVVAGVSLYTAMKEARRARSDGREDAGLPWATVTFIMIVRFVVWPVVSISVIYALAKKTGVLGEDPMLWFAMMLMPTGPPAMKLITLVQVSDADEAEETNIAKLLTLSYAISPILSFTVVGGLRAAQAAL